MVASFLPLGFTKYDQEVPWISLVYFQSCRDGVSCGAETEFSNATIAYRLDANSYQVSGLWSVNHRAQELNLLPWSTPVSTSSLTPRQINIILERRRVYTTLHSIWGELHSRAHFIWDLTLWQQKLAYYTSHNIHFSALPRLTKSNFV